MVQEPIQVRIMPREQIRKQGIKRTISRLNRVPQSTSLAAIVGGTASTGAVT
jgi:hypothetical protein